MNSHDVWRETPGQLGTFPSFADFFVDVHGFAPYAWQQELADYLVEHGRVPGQVSIPTGMGKTSMVDAVVWALARQSHLGTPRTLGQRIFFIVERRIIVDGAGDHVDKLVDAITSARTTTSACGVVATALSQLGVAGDPVLEATTFHGTRSGGRDWLRPTGAQIIVTTATQLTLRLAGRAPGVGHGSAPVHAGLAGMDAVYLFDEPHLAVQQVNSVGDVCRIQSEYVGLGAPAPQLAVLGATIPPGLQLPKGIITLDDSVESEIALSRYRAPRPTQVVECEDGAGDVVKALVDAVTAGISDSSGEHPLRRVLVVANTVAVARNVTTKLAAAFKGTKKNPATYTVELITSRVRGCDRKNTDSLGKPGVITVSTQVVEAGADFEVDLFITELAPWSALAQRIGRLNRYGGAADPSAVVVVPAKTKKSDAKGPADRTDLQFLGSSGARAIYGDDSLLATGLILTLMRDHAESEVMDLAPSQQHDFVEKGLCAVSKHLGLEVSRQDLWPSQTERFYLTDPVARMYLDTSSAVFDAEVWRTGVSPEPRVSPVITLLWRDSGVVGPSGTELHGDMSEDDRNRRVNGLVSTMLGRGPLPGETVEVPLAEAQRVLHAVKLTTDTSDGFEIDPDNYKAEGYQGPTAPCAVLRETWQDLGEETTGALRDGDTVVIDAAWGGYTSLKGVIPADQTPVTDMSLVLALEHGQWAAVTEGALHGAGVDADTIDGVMEILEDLDRSFRERIIDIQPVLEDTLGRKDFEIRAVAGQLALFFTEQVETAEGSVSLHDHLVQVGNTATVLAEGLPLSAHDQSALTRAGYLHDVGKATAAFQRMLGARDGELLAKSAGRVSVSPERASLPRGYRHELASANPAVTPDETDLSRWLIASHHGRGRGSWAGRPDTANLAGLRAGLEDQYGPWGLAYLEAVLRCADIQASAYPEEVSSELPEYAASAMQRVIDMDDAGMILDQVSAPVSTGVTEFRLEGLAGLDMLNWGAAVGAAVFASAYDSAATVHWDGDVPVVTAVMEEAAWDDSARAIVDGVRELSEWIARETGFEPGLKNGHHRYREKKGKVSGEVVLTEEISRCAAEAPVSLVLQRMIPVLFPVHQRREKVNFRVTNLGDRRTLQQRMMEPMSQGHDAGLLGSANFRSALNHSNGSIVDTVLGSSQPVNSEVLWNASAGWVDGSPKDIGRLEFSKSAVVRRGVLPYAILGLLSAPAVHEEGLGATGKGSSRKRILPVPERPMSVDAVLAITQAVSPDMVGIRVLSADIETYGGSNVRTNPSVMMG